MESLTSTTSHIKRNLSSYQYLWDLVSKKMFHKSGLGQSLNNPFLKSIPHKWINFEVFLPREGARMVVTTSSNKKYFQAISPSEDLQLGACAAILNIPVTHRQDMFVPIPHICHFFTHAKFLENKIYTKIYSVNCQFTQ